MDDFIDARIGYEFGTATTGPTVTASGIKGTHGYFPEHSEMRATLIIDGQGLPRHGDLGEIDMRRIAPTVAKLLGVSLPSAPEPPLF